MTSWERVRGSVKPLEVDLESSPHVVYLHKNIAEVEIPDEMSGGTLKQWEYDEVTMDRQEWEQVKSIYPILYNSINSTDNLDGRATALEEMILELSGVVYA